MFLTVVTVGKYSLSPQMSTSPTILSLLIPLWYISHKLCFQMETDGLILLEIPIRSI